jgi:hypothetical protein
VFRLLEATVIWVLVGVVFLLLWTFWRFLEITFDLIANWHTARRRDDDEPVGEAGKQTIGVGSSVSP